MDSPVDSFEFAFEFEFAEPVASDRSPPAAVPVVDAEVVSVDECSTASEVVPELVAELVGADVSFAVPSGVTTSYRDTAPFHKAHTCVGAGWISKRPAAQQLASPSQQKAVSEPV